jgi:hypothetical protein
MKKAEARMIEVYRHVDIIMKGVRSGEVVAPLLNRAVQVKRGRACLSIQNMETGSTPAGRMATPHCVPIQSPAHAADDVLTLLRIHRRTLCNFRVACKIVWTVGESIILFCHD